MGQYEYDWLRGNCEVRLANHYRIAISQRGGGQGMQQLFWAILPNTLLALCLQVQQSFLIAQEIKPLAIDLSQGNPISPELIEFVSDSNSTSDRVEQVEQGIRIQKLGGKGSTPCGIILKQTATSAFTLYVDLEVVQLSPPRTAGTQGLLVQFAFDSSEQQTFTVGLSSAGRNGERTFVFYSGADTQPDGYQFVTSSFSKGTWLIKREGDEFKLSISDSMESRNLPESSDSSAEGREGRYFPTNFREIKRVSVGTAPLRQIQIVCRRQDSAKPISEFLLKKIRFSGDQFYSQPLPAIPFWTAAKVYSILFWLSVITVVVYAISRFQQIKAWVLEKLG